MQWFTYVVYPWRTAASTVWLIILTTPILFVYQLIYCNLLWWTKEWVESLVMLAYIIFYYLSLIFLHISHSWSLTVKPVIGKTRLEKLWNIIKPNHFFIICFYVAMATTQAMCLMTFSGSTQHHIRLPVMTQGAFLGLLYSLRYFKNNDYVLLFPTLQQRKLFRIKAHFVQLLKRALLFYFKDITVIIPICFLLNWWSSGLVTSIKMFFDIWLLLQMILSGITLYITWYVSIKLFRVFHSEAIRFLVIASFTEESPRVLSNALKSDNLLLKYLGFLDLADISLNSPARRRQIFGLSSQGQPATWDTIHLQCIQVIQSFIKQLGGQVLEQTPSFPPITEQRSKLTTNKGWYYPDQVTQSVITRRQIVNKRACLSYSGTQDVAPPHHEDQWKQVREAIITLKKVPKALAVYLKKKAIFSFFLKELPEATHDTTYCQTPLYLWAITALCQLSSKSYYEDKYGVVQRTLPNTLNTLLQLSLLLEKQVRQPFGSAHFDDNRLVLLLRNGKYALKTAVNEGLQLLSQTFHHETRFLQLTNDNIQQWNKLHPHPIMTI